MKIVMLDRNSIGFDIDVDLFAIQLLQLDFSHTSMSTTQRYCGEMERAKAIVVNNMNIGLDILRKYL